MVPDNKIFHCAVIGSSGYIGRHLVYSLNQTSHKLTLFDIQNPESNHDNQYHKLDITNRSEVERILWDFDYIFYFAGLTGTYAGFDQYEKFIALNELGLLNLLSTIRHQKLKPRIIFPSSRLVYKGSDEPLKEDDAKDPKTIYAVNKLSGEHFIRNYHIAFGIPYNIFRICVPYGIQTDVEYSFGTIGTFLKMAHQNLPVTLFGDGSLKRTFTHIEDLCRQILTVSFMRESENQTFNIAGESYSLEEVAMLVAQKYNVGVKYVSWPEKDLLIESGHTVFDADRIRAFMKNPLIHQLRNWINDYKN
jgi:UDP-glucose 4-epimerase